MTQIAGLISTSLILIEVLLWTEAVRAHAIRTETLIVWLDIGDRAIV